MAQRRVVFWVDGALAMVSVGLDVNNTERFDFTAIDIGWTVFHLAIH